MKRVMNRGPRPSRNRLVAAGWFARGNAYTRISGNAPRVCLRTSSTLQEHPPSAQGDYCNSGPASYTFSEPQGLIKAFICDKKRPASHATWVTKKPGGYKKSHLLRAFRPERVPNPDRSLVSETFAAVGPWIVVAKVARVEGCLEKRRFRG